MPVRFTQDLQAAVDAAGPNDGVSFGSLTDKSSWRIDWRPEATPEQRAAGQSIVDSYDPVAAQTAALARVAGLKGDAMVAQLVDKLQNATVQQIDDWLSANMTTLAQARAIMAALIKYVAMKN